MDARGEFGEHERSARVAGGDRVAQGYFSEHLQN